MGSFYDDNDDLRFYIERAVDWEPLVRLTEVDLQSPGAPASVAEAVEGYRDILALVGTFAADEIAPHARALDKAHPKLVDGAVVSPPGGGGAGARSARSASTAKYRARLPGKLE